jgi:serine/threonine protein kinase
VSEGPYSRLFSAIDEVDGGIVVLKFPKPQIGKVASYHAAFVREAWVGRQLNSPWLAHVIELPEGRKSCLYTVMPLYVGEQLETRLSRRPALGLEEGRGVAIRLARAVAALHRAGDPIAISGRTMSFWAPEMFEGETGNEATDIYALGVTMFRAFTGAFPYDNVDATSPPRLARPKDLTVLRPDLPAGWTRCWGARLRSILTDASTTWLRSPPTWRRGRPTRRCRHAGR